MDPDLETDRTNLQALIAVWEDEEKRLRSLYKETSSMSMIALLQEEWRGWNSLSIGTALLHARIVPELGGRTMEYQLGEHAFLWSNPQLHALPSQESCELWMKWGGDKVWLAPQGWEAED